MVLLLVLGHTSTSKSTVTALIVRGLKWVINYIIEYRLQTESTITVVISTLAYGSNVL